MEHPGRICTIKIDGKSVSVNEGTTILEAGRKVGVEIPTLCHHPALEPYGVCRVCIVELKRGKRTRVVKACNFPIEADGMEVFTNSERIEKDRRVVIELALARCFSSPVIREFAARFGILDTDLEKTFGQECILCGQCVNVCRDLIGQAAIGFESRGGDRKTATPFGKPNDRCIGCGACVFVCPTGCIKMEDLPEERMIDRWTSLMPVLKCRSCGIGFGTVRQLELLKNRQPMVKSYLETCPQCRAKEFGQALASESAGAVKPVQTGGFA
jgi:bidirectional [NiFe] hydrogenase diaphorase subunit